MQAVENKGPQLQILAIALISLAWVGVALRAYTRFFIVKKITWDDRFVAASLVFYSIYCSFVLVGVHYGTGRFDANLDVRDLLTAHRYWYYCEWAYVITMCMIKVAITILYLRLFIEKWQRRVIWITLVIVIATGVAYLLAVVLQCVPVTFIWHRYEPNTTHKGFCLPRGIVLGGTYIHSAVSAISDFTLAGLPVVLLWNVRFAFWKKFWIGVMMGLGAIAVIATLIRLRFIESLVIKKDFLYHTFGVAIWSTVEPGIALFAVCLSVLRPLAARFWDIRLVRTIATLRIDPEPVQEEAYGTLQSGSARLGTEATMQSRQREGDVEAAMAEVAPGNILRPSHTSERQQESDSQQFESSFDFSKATVSSSEAPFTLELDREMTNPTMLPLHVIFAGLDVPEMSLNRWSQQSWGFSKRDSKK
ncbi:hypothetical protein ONS95_014084 [Cadophora gregata]|uniref:uncharacterized protein n=1 Tax=Cadophora gregata TaxID=51156 RepID=UPI0026DDB9F6|nr:uncharacterized protein ONS95_014084 [Cadophora gregata]KAK0113837.1 hypothetical protein ONS96_014690 [Cadophora gregata f. sp. sojae]KAK0114598.1 hypothetical protein ONS95_014084 [Cadophora gregata]